MGTPEAELPQDREDELMHWVEADDSFSLVASIVESSVDALVGLRLDGTVMVWNPGAERTYGWSATEMLGQSIDRIVPPALRSELEFLMSRIRRHEVVRDLVTKRVRKDGKSIDVSLSASPLLNSEGGVVGAVKSERDISARRRQDAIADGQRRLLEMLTRTGKLRPGLEALLKSLTELTQDSLRAAVMQIDAERSLLTLTAGDLPKDLQAVLQEGLPIAPQGHPAGEAAFSGQAVSGRDLRELARWDAAPAVDAGLLSCCSTPIVATNGEVLGTLDLYGQTVGDPPTDDLEVVSALAQTAALVMDRFRTFRDLRSSRATLAALNKINASLATELDIERILQRVAKEGVRLLGAQMGAFFYGGKQASTLGFQIHAVAGEHARALGDTPMPSATLLFSQTIKGKITQRFDDVTKDPRFGKGEQGAGWPLKHVTVRSCMMVPVTAREGDLIGMLLFGHEESGRFGRWHEEVIRGVAAQAALALDNATLHEETRERAQAMAEADRRKDQFLAVLGHELRNPLNAIAASMQVLRETIPEGGEVSEVGDILHRQVKHMGRLVDDLLDMGRITRGEIPMQRRVQDLRAAVRNAIAAIRSLAARDDVTIRLVEFEEPCWSEIDGVRIEQIVGNLLHNAVKFAPGTEVLVEVECDGGDIIVRVTDRGRGIAEEDLGRIFELFTQVDGELGSEEAGGAGGLGLGLSLVRQLVAAHGGSVVARSDGRSQGAVFEVRVPLTEAPCEDEQEQEQEQVALSNGTTNPESAPVVIAEDQPDAAKAMCMLLERWGHEVRHAGSGAEAIAAATDAMPAIAIVDIGLPDMDGWDLAERLRALPGGESLRIAALTGLGQTRDVERSRAAGIDEHFVKPVDPTTLRAWLLQGASR